MKNSPNLFHERRVQLDFDVRKTGGVSHLGRLNYEKARHPLGSHRHHDAMEICYLARGRQTYVVNGTSFQLKPGDVFVTFPNEIHSSGGEPEEKSILYWLVVDLEARDPLFLLPLVEARLLRDALASLNRRHFQAARNLNAPLDQAIVEFRKEGPWRYPRVRNHLLEFVTRIIETAATNDGEGGRHSPTINSVLTYIEKNLDRAANVNDLAKVANLSASRFKQKFKQEVGIPPGEYFLRRKIEAAEEMLSRDRLTVTDVAFRLGFSSSQYFATVFKRFNAISPLAFRKTRAVWKECPVAR